MNGIHCQDGYLNPSGLDPSLVEGQGFTSKVDDLMRVDGLGKLEELPYLVKAEPC